MIKVMLVDDEYMLLRGIQLLIDWTAYGFEIVQTEQNPVKALAYLQDQPIDILISDMNMPEMAGPEFVTQAKQLQPEMELLVISGYDNFDYVHAGLQQNAVNYLRKPIDTDELIAALAEAKQHLADRQLMQHNASLAAQTRVRTLLTTDSATTQTQMLAALNVTFTAATPLRLIGILNPLPPQALVRYLSTQTTVKGYYGEGQDFIILFQGSRSALNQFIEQAPQQIGADRRPFLVGAPIAKPAALATGYTQLKREIARQYFFETAAGLRIMLPENQSVVTPDLPGYSTLKQAIGRVKLPTFETWLTAQFDELKQQNASDTLARQFALIVLLVLADQVTTFNDRERYIEAINHAHDVGELKQPLIQVAELVVETGHQHFSRNVLAMRQVIAERYAEPLSLTLIAGELHLNPVYLGQQFKQEVGRSFAQFLNDYRVSVAVDLLRGSDQDIGEIADAIGYQNSSYFFKLFKQQTGMSPGEYRKAGS